MSLTEAKALKIRLRERRGRPREALGEHISWTEWQVVNGRKVVARFDLREQAKAYVDQAIEAAQ